MSGESLIRLTSDVRLEDRCESSWTMAGGQTAAYAAPQQSPETGWGFFCTKHGAQFGVHQSCPRSFVEHRAGETLSVPSKLARHLVEHEVAVYPTHVPEPQQGVQDTLNRVNSMLEAQGLPLTDAEAMGILHVEGRRTPYQRPARPRDRRLANDLGMDPGDIADMRRLSQGG